MSSTTQPTQDYSSFYAHIGSYPELGIFRRFGGYWAKRLYDETSELVECITKLEEELRKWPGFEATTVLDCPKRLLKEIKPRSEEERSKLESLCAKWDAYDKALLQYGEILCVSEQVMNLPSQNIFYNKKLVEWKMPEFKPIFDNGDFYPTGEPAEHYRDDPQRSDTFAWRTLPHEDILTKCLLHAGPWIEKHVVKRWSQYRKTNSTGGTTSMQFGHLVAIMDTLACIIASLMLVATIAILVVVQTMTARVVLIGVFGTLFAFLLKLMAGNPSRGEVFAATAAFYAVAAVFVGSDSASK
ncbi:hypothetical protein BDU57DRAFT_583016 [Ampelomyces quisqualis]|uniref:DUF6594 domain-containing protein n=1 Tax=Ampelomyces quisqualis TaxID=50730 RepID=A0A6A5QEJ7_AMPQU|nr:hypothetical protein BDU57DRAFT_583016 [Ampelomyces quisqualis]